MDIKRTKRIIDYMESAQDNTSAHSEIDKYLLDNEMGHKYQHTMGEYNEPWQPMPEDALPMGAGVKLFRGVPKWFRGQMVKKGKYMSPTLKRRWSPWDIQEGVWATRSKQYAKDMAKTPNKKGMVLEFDVPTKWWEWASEPFRKDVIRRMQGKSTAMPNFYREGIPKKYLKKVHKGYQEGGPIDLESAVQDETAHSQMDRLMFENELEQQPQHSIRAYNQPQWPMPEDALPVGGALRLLKGTKKYKTMLGQLNRLSKNEKKRFEVLEGARRRFGDKLDAGAADDAGQELMTTMWIRKLFE